MRARTVVILLGLTALVSYSLGRHDAPTGKLQPAVVVQGPTSSEKQAPVALATLPDSRPVSPVTPELSGGAEQLPPSLSKPIQPGAKQKAEAVLSAATVVALIIRASRDQYHATGHLCACPDDLMRNGRACGARSAYSRPGGAAPKCYPSDITESMISDYRRAASR